MNEKQNINPFPATAVARLKRGDHDLFTISTSALKELLSEFEDYINENQKKGKTICIIGEYGTGKTHLAYELLKAIDFKNNSKLHSFYLDAPSDTFLELYLKRFIVKLKRNLVLERIDDFYCELVIDDLKDDPIYKEIIDKLESKSIKAYDVVLKLGLMESSFQNQLQKKLAKVTENKSFLKALYLFQIPEFEDAVWNWFTGNPPSESLVEQGVTQSIDNDASALEAIGVFAFLFGQQGHRFILIIDELEKVFSSSNIHFPDESSILAFKKLFEAVSDTQALLVLSGLPDFYDFLPDDAKQRITKIIRPSPLSGIQVSNFIKEANKKKAGESTIKPFSASVAEYIAKITGGNARRISRICYHSYQLAKVENENVTNLIVEKVLKEQLSTTTTDDINKEITQLIEGNGWEYEKNKIFKIKKKEYESSFWMPLNNENEGIILISIQNLFNEKEANDLISKSKKLRIQDDKGICRAVILVVSGFIADNLQDNVVKGFDKIVTYNLKHFKDDLSSVLNGLRLKLEDRGNNNLLEDILKQIEQLQRRNNSLRMILEEVATKKDINNLYNLIARENSQQRLLPSRNSPFYPILIKIDRINTIYQPVNSFNQNDKYIFRARDLISNYDGPLNSLNLVRFYFYHFNELIITGNYNRILSEHRGDSLLIEKLDKLLLFSGERISMNYKELEIKLELSDKNKNEIDYKLHSLLLDFEKLSFKLYNYLENANISNDEFKFNKLLLPRNSELNSYFIRIEGLLLTIQSMLKNILNYYYTQNNFNDIDEIEKALLGAIPVINMSYFFMNWITNNLQEFQFRHKAKSSNISHFIEEFDYKVFRKLLSNRGLERLFEFSRYIEREIREFKNLPFSEDRYDLSEIIEELHRLPKETYHIIRKEIY